ncbi:MAG: DedA family protein [Candidatus Dadabacteria bacterium]|nr:MAG: DedA family protein [Candidatus Dadabacteria bacterium]
MLHQIVEKIVSLVGGMGYTGIFLLMVVESSFIPFPSEVVLIPAGYLAKKGEMDLTLITLAGVGGSLVGAYINYFLSIWLGRKIILRYGKYFLLPPDRFEFLERVFLRHSAFVTFAGRLIFGVRQWISVPAGLSRMNLFSFSFYTVLGASIWVVILISLGYILGTGKESTAMAKLVGYWLLAAVAVMGAIYWIWYKKTSKCNEEGSY